MSRYMSLITGTAYHRSPRPANQPNSGWRDRHLEHRVGGQLVQRDRRAGLLHDQGEQVEPARRAALPGQPRSRARRVRFTFAGSPVTAPSAGLVARVPHELRAEDPRSRPVRGVRREHGDHRPDPAAVGRLAQVHDRLGGDVRGRGDLTAVAHPQAPPVQPPDAPGAVPPGDPRAELQLGLGVPVGARGLDLAADMPEPPAGRPRVVLAVEQRDEPLGAGEQAVQGEANRHPRSDRPAGNAPGLASRPAAPAAIGVATGQASSAIAAAAC